MTTTHPSASNSSPAAGRSSLPTRQVTFEWPQLRRPIYFIVDDPAPALNLAHFEQYWEPHTRDVPASFTEQWADLVEEFDVRGKFSVLPVPAGIGRIDRPLPGVDPAEQAAFLDIVRQRIVPQMDICIEFLTHFIAWDLRRECPCDFTEKEMAPHTNRGHLTEYFTYGLRILHDLGLQPTGATSPGASCRSMEWDYQAAIRDAVRQVTGRKLAWYFLHVDTESPVVLPKVMSLDRESGAGCVHMPSAGYDISWQTQWEDPSLPDLNLSADGQSGRLMELYRNGSVLSFHTHWQSLFSEGRATGLRDLGVLLGRIHEHLGGAVRWTKCSDLAQVMAARSTTQVSVWQTPAGLEVELQSPTPCPDFTGRVAVEGAVRTVHAGEMELRRLPDGAAFLKPGSWKQEPGGIAWCADLPEGGQRLQLTLQTAGA